MSKSVANSQQSLEDVISLVRQAYELNKYIEVDIVVKGKARTGQQRKSLQVYCREMAIKLNESGQDYKKFLDYISAKGMAADWTEENFKDVFRLYGTAMYPDKVTMDTVTSKPTIKTSELSKKELSDLYELVNMRMSTIFGVGMPWPSKE